MRQTRALSRHAADQLIDGAVREPEMLARVLDAARAPGTASELGGLEAARAAFLSVMDAPESTTAAAGAATAPVARRGRIRRPAVLKGLTAATLATKLIAGAAAAAAAGGVALAAVAHDSPHHTAPSASSSLTASSQPGTRTSHHPAPASHHHAGAPAVTIPSASLSQLASSVESAGGTSAAPAQLLVLFCQAWDGSGSTPGSALDTPQFQAAVDAAGGPQQVTAYCTDLLSSASSSASPTAPATDSTSPTSSDSTTGTSPSGTTTSPSTPSTSGAGSGLPSGTETGHGSPGSGSGSPSDTSSGSASSTDSSDSTSPSDSGSAVNAPVSTPSSSPSTSSSSSPQGPHVAPSR